MRESFSDILVESALRDPRIYLLTGDHGYALFDSLRKQCSHKYVNAGVAEQNMVGVAAGMSKMGLVPIVYGLSAFIPMRVLEQIKLDLCFERLQVILIGDGAGLVYSKLGVSHQCFEDISALRAIPHIQILSPCDDYEMKLCMQRALNYKGPTYIRMGKSDLGNVHEKAELSQTGIHTIKKGKKGSPVILATGSMVKVAESLIQKEFPDFALHSLYQLKPLNEKSILEAVGESELVITMEEHNIFGGLGSIVTELLSSHSPRKILRIGIQDQFTRKCGTYEYLLEEHKLDAKSISAQIKATLRS